MIIRKAPQPSGICFAWLPKRTVTGWVWLERVFWERIESWGWGSDDTFVYHRIPEYVTPPDVTACQNYRTDGPTPCRYPRCMCSMPETYVP
jgi:hypothetical protein